MGVCVERVRGFRSLVAVGLLVLITGAHWSALQTAAWTRMFVGFARSGSLAQAWEKTFDGEHACALCRTVERGKRADQERSPGVVRTEWRWEFDVPAVPPPR